VRKADNFTTFMCRLSLNVGALTSWNLQDLSRPVTGLPTSLLPFRSIEGNESFVTFCSVLFRFVPFCSVLFRFVTFCYVLFRFVTLCYVLLRFVTFCYFCSVLFRFVPFCSVLFRFVTFCYVLLRFASPSTKCLFLIFLFSLSFFQKLFSLISYQVAVWR
jgi:hypothetical protein